MEPGWMDVKEALKILTESVKRSCIMEEISDKNLERGVGFIIRVDGGTGGERAEPFNPFPVEGGDSSSTIDIDGFVGKTNHNSIKMCLDGYLPIQSEDGGKRTKGDRVRVCVDVGEKLIACFMAEANKPDKEA